MIEGVTNSGSIPVLERLIQFAGQRHKLIANNIANLSTPGFRPQDLSVDAFQELLGEAVDERRARHGNTGGPLEIQNTAQLEFRQGGLDVHPEATGDNILFHDGNDRNLERIMQSLVENASTFRMAAQLMRSRFELINTAIRERI